MQDLSPQIISSVDTTKFDERTGRPMAITVTTYRLGALGPFTVEIPAAEFTDAALRAEIDKKAAALRPFA